MIIQLNHTIPITTPKGEGIAHFLIDYGIEHDLYWVIFITATQECWTFSNKVIRACKNITIGRKVRDHVIPHKIQVEQLTERPFSVSVTSSMGEGNLS